MTETRWLDDDERRIWLSYLLSTRLLLGQLERDMQRSANMPLITYEILATLSEFPDRALRMSQLAEMLQVSPSRLSHAIDRVAASGWVRRERCASDSRGWIAVLTDDGYDVLVDAAPSHLKSVREHLVDQLTRTQLERLGDVSQSLLGHLAPGFCRFSEPAWMTEISPDGSE